MNRDIKLLSADFRFKVQRFLGDARIKELGVFITEGFRTTERQQELYAQGRTKPGSIVTWVDGVKNQSMHQLSEAIDIAFTGKELYPTDFKIWREVADIAKTYGISWGYDLWGVDKPHLQSNPLIPAHDVLDEYKELTLEEKIKKLRDRPETYSNLSLKGKIARLSSRYTNKTLNMKPEMSKTKKLVAAVMAIVVGIAGFIGVYQKFKAGECTIENSFCQEELVEHLESIEQNGATVIDEINN